jgi:hypothetical protein
LTGARDEDDSEENNGRGDENGLRTCVHLCTKSFGLSNPPQ